MKYKVPTHGPVVPPDRVLQRVVERASRPSEPDECWPWPISLGSHGYGQIGWSENGHTTMTTAHRAMWMAVNGAIPEGFTVDHICRNRPCVNPQHLRLLSNVENATDNGQDKKTHCPQGHEYTKANTYVNPRGFRYCIQCRKRWR